MYAGTCQHHHPQAAGIDLGNNEDYQKHYETLIKAIWNKEVDVADVPFFMYERSGKVLNKAVSDAKKWNMAYNAPDHILQAELRTNVWQFSGAKTATQMAALRAKLTDKDTIKSFADFKREALKIDSEYNLNWLKTEYNQALNGAASAAQWHDLQANKDLFPYLIYRTVGDERVRTSHKGMEGIKRHIDDAFWKQYYPPNGWMCRCTVEQTADDSDMADRDKAMQKAAKATPKSFRNNISETKKLFGEKHPYFEIFDPLDPKNPNLTLTAANLGFQDVETMYKKRKNMPEALDTGNETKEEAKELFDKLIKKHKGEKGRFNLLNKKVNLNINITPKFLKDHILDHPKDNRYYVPKYLEDVLQNADEVWYGYQHHKDRNKAGYAYKFLKYYKNNAVIGFAWQTKNGTIELRSLYKEVADNSHAQRNRQGVLL